MRRFGIFVAIGSFTALVTELIFNIFITGNYGNFVFTIFFYPIYLSAVMLVQRVLFGYVKSRNLQMVTSYGLFGLIGMSFEWFVIGNSPWGNPQALQFGQLSFWTAVVLVPMLYLDGDFRIRRGLYIYTGVYVGVAAVALLLLPVPYRIVLAVWTTVCYGALHALYGWQLFLPWRSPDNARNQAA